MFSTISPLHTYELSPSTWEETHLLFFLYPQQTPQTRQPILYKNTGKYLPKLFSQGRESLLSGWHTSWKTPTGMDGPCLLFLSLSIALADSLSAVANTSFARLHVLSHWEWQSLGSRRNRNNALHLRLSLTLVSFSSISHRSRFYDIAILEFSAFRTWYCRDCFFF